MSAGVADRMARLRASPGLRTPDAIHVATALEWGAQAFLTNDAGLRQAPGIEVLLLSDFL